MISEEKKYRFLWTFKNSKIEFGRNSEKEKTIWEKLNLENEDYKIYRVLSLKSENQSFFQKMLIVYRRNGEKTER